MEQIIKDIRTALADYIASEGCGCCRREKEHSEALQKLGKLLKVKKYKDGDGYDFSKYKTSNNPTAKKEM